MLVVGVVLLCGGWQRGDTYIRRNTVNQRYTEGGSAGWNRLVCANSGVGMRRDPTSTSRSWNCPRESYGLLSGAVFVCAQAETSDGGVLTPTLAWCHNTE